MANCFRPGTWSTTRPKRAWPVYRTTMVSRRVSNPATTAGRSAAACSAPPGHTCTRRSQLHTCQLRPP
ncbi:hypothetical protein CONLIGDRAFT_465634 [Coniochaeta ligniaria NRRL 30616]|uniref:Uncharacterized protein n=1 Tax=Coniochaeta ligniaria NRRL 30616 TaxID=1408157 RepID=A0A1J7I3P9_9PEZI|nr:hypothetical protein CONLIGDRAFT_465634 [Coniochaeta ligniaria NRRL 30616]